MGIIMQFDLHSHKQKVSTTESERVVDPETTVEIAMEALDRIKLKPEIQTWNHDDVFWTACANYRQENVVVTRPILGRINSGRSTEGKGITKIQATASCLMELVERVSLAQVVVRDDRTPHFFDCKNIRTGEDQTIILPITNAQFCGAGNTYEECVLHGLHETIELALPGTPFKPVKVVNLEKMFPHWPESLLSSICIFMVPSDKSEFYRMIALRCPVDDRFDPEMIVVNENGLIAVREYPAGMAGGVKHSAYCGSAGGLNPELVIQRAIWETFQGVGTRKDIYPAKKKQVPSWIESVDAVDLPNYETETISGDINLILNVLGETAYTAAIDITSPDLQIPVAFVFAEYFPSFNYASRTIAGMMFDIDELITKTLDQGKN